MRDLDFNFVSSSSLKSKVDPTDLTFGDDTWSFSVLLDLLLEERAIDSDFNGTAEE